MGGLDVIVHFFVLTPMSLILFRVAQQDAVELLDVIFGKWNVGEERCMAPLTLAFQNRNCFITYFRKSGVEDRINFKPAEAVVPFNGFSFYKIEYKGELPESLVKAFQKMNELDEELPRKKFKKERKNNPLWINIPAAPALLEKICGSYNLFIKMCKAAAARSTYLYRK